MIQNLRRLFGVLDRWKWRYVSAGLLLVAGIGARSLEPRVLQFAVDHVIAHFGGDGKSDIFGGDRISQYFRAVLPDITGDNLGWVLAALGGIFLGIAALRSGLSLASSLLTADSTEKAIKHLRDRLFAHVQRLPMSYFTTMPKGDLLQRSTGDIHTVRGFIHNHIVDVMRTLALFGFSFAMMLSINVRFALIAVAFGPFLALTSFVFFKRERKIWKTRQDEADKLDTVVQENLNGIRTVKAFTNEAFEIDKFAARNRDKLSVDLRHLKLHTLFWPASDFLVNLQITLTVLAGGYFAINGVITIGELLSFYAYSTMISWPMRQFGRILSKIGVAMVSISRIYEVLDAGQETREGFASALQLKGEIEFRNVCFRYDKSSRKNVLNNVSFQIRPGEKVAIVGPTGAGKSTIISLLVGLYEVDSGQVLIDGRDVQKFSPRYLRGKIGFVLQTPFLFSTTVKANIAYAQPGAEMNNIVETAKIAQADQLETALPKGFDTLVGEKGVTLSGGQKQRVALARTLLTEPDILVLDDVTSAVDTHTEAAIFEALQEPLQRKTTIIISHRVASIQQADRILVVDNGRIVQEGSKEELAKREGYFRDIHLIQTALEEEIQGNVLE